MYRRLFAEIRGDFPGIVSALSNGFRRFIAWLIHVRLDVLIAVLLGLAIGGFCLFLSLRIPPALVDPRLDAWVWFEADLIRVYKSFTSLGPHNWRTNVHPLQAIIMYPPTKALIKLGVAEAHAVFAMMTFYAAAWGAFFYAALRGLGLRRPDSAIFTALVASSASFVFWFTVPEVYGLGALTVMFSVAVAVAAKRFDLPAFWQSVGCAASMAATTTNWIVGIALAFSNNSYRRATRIVFDALIIITIFFGLQKLMDASVNFFVPVVWAEALYVFHDLSGSIFDKLRSFFLFSIAIPTIPFVDNPNFPDWMRLTVQFTPLSELKLPAVLALLLWVPLLAIGTVTALQHAETKSIAVALVSYIVFQFALHSVYGDETFLYSLNYLPVLVLLAACGALSSLRMPILAAAVAITALNLVNNVGEFTRVTDDIAAHAEDLLARKPELLAE